MNARDEVRLGDIAQVHYGKATPSESGSVPLVGSGGVFGGTARPLVKGPVLVIGRKGTAGKVWFIERDCWPSDTTFYIEWKTDGLDARFAFHHFEFRPLSGEHAKTTLPSVKREALEGYSLALPPVEEQRAIARALRAVQEAKEARQRELALERERKAALMEYLFTHGTRGEPRKQTEIGEIPDRWQVDALAAAVPTIDYGLSAPIPSTAPHNGVKIVSTADVTKDGRLLYVQIRYIAAPARTISRLALRTGDVLFNWRNSPELVGKTAIFEEQNETHIFASFILRMRCDEVRSHNVFLAYLLNHWREKGVFIRLARRAVNQANYNRNEISVLKIPLPSYEEQLEIAAILIGCDNVLAAIQNEMQLHEELFRAMLEELMTGRLSAAPLIDQGASA